MSADVRTEPIVHERQIEAWLTLVHRDLPAPERANHDGGWDTMLVRLASAVAP